MCRLLAILRIYDSESCDLLNFRDESPASLCMLTTWPMLNVPMIVLNDIFYTFSTSCNKYGFQQLYIWHPKSILECIIELQIFIEVCVFVCQSWCDKHLSKFWFFWHSLFSVSIYFFRIRPLSKHTPKNLTSFLYSVGIYVGRDAWCFPDFYVGKMYSFCLCFREGEFYFWVPLYHISMDSRSLFSFVFWFVPR